MAPARHGAPAAQIIQDRPVLPPATARHSPEPVYANAPDWCRPATGSRRCPAAGPSRRTQPPCGRDRSRCGNPVVPGHPARLWPPPPQLGGYVNIRPMLLRLQQCSQALPGSAYRRKCPADLPLRAPATVGPPPGTTLPLSRASSAGNQSAWGRQHQRSIRTSAGYQQVSLSVTVLVQGNGRAPASGWKV
jgi:hypothetical protein